MQHRVAVEERAAAAVLPGQADLEAFVQQARVRERLGEPPVEAQLARGHPPTVVDDLLHLPMQHVAVGVVGDPLGQPAQHVGLEAGAHDAGPVHLDVVAPVDGVLVADQADHVARLAFAGVEPAPAALDHRVGFLAGERTGGNEPVGVELARGRLACGSPGT